MRNNIISFLAEHPIFTATEDLKTLCRPLQNLQISYFSQARINRAGELAVLATNPGFAEHYFKNNYFNADIHLAEIDTLGNYILWDNIERCGLSAQMHGEAAQFGVEHTFTIVEPISEQGERNFFHFATDTHCKSVNQTYFANLDLLKKFISYFNEHINASPILKSAYDFKLRIDQDAAGYTTTHNKISSMDNMRQRFLQALHSHSSPLPDHTDKSTLTPQQAQCLNLLVQGFPAKKIANVLKLSSRTVDNYLAAVRKVSGCRNSKELIMAYYAGRFSI